MTLKKCKYKLFLSKEWIKRINIFFKRWTLDFLDFCYPSYCWICNKNLPDNQLLCASCEATLPWTSFTPLVQDDIGITIERLWIQNLVVLFWTNHPHFLQKIISSLDHPRYAIWMDFFNKHLIQQVRQSSQSFDFCIHVTDSYKNLFQRDTFANLISNIQKEFQIPKINPYTKRFGIIKKSFKLKDGLTFENKSILIIADSLSNPNIKTITTLLKKQQTQQITLICLINRI